MTHNEHIGRKTDCLDKGFVRLVDVMGDDAAIVQAARVSYGSGTKKIHEDRGLIRYLLRHSHTTPFEMVEFKFHIKIPIFVARQWIRHRTANVNEYSGRYSEMKDEFYVPDAQSVRTQSEVNKQGRSDITIPEDTANDLTARMEQSQNAAYDEYQHYLAAGVAREIARINLPVSNYTEWYWKIDLHNLFHFLRLRMDAHAQYEIRVYAEAIAGIIRDIVPIAYEAFNDYVLGAEKFSRLEVVALRNLIAGGEISMNSLETFGLKGREAREFVGKIRKIAGEAVLIVEKQPKTDAN